MSIRLMCSSIRLLCSTANLVNQENSRTSENDSTKKINFWSKVCVTSLDASVLFGTVFEVPGRVLTSLKESEFYVRIASLPIGLNRLNTEKSISSFEKDILAPIMGIVRTHNEWAAFHSSQLSDETVVSKVVEEPPKYDLSKDPEYPFFPHANSSNDSAVECSSEKEIDKPTEDLPTAEIVETALSVETLQKCVDSFRKIFKLHQQNQKRSLDFTSFASLDFVPDSLHSHPILSCFKCTITQTPIRHVVCDPNGKTLYERSAIEQWLENKQVSPVTGRKMEKKDLLERKAIQSVINYHLKLIDSQMQKKDT